MDFNLGFPKSILIFFFLLRICRAVDTIIPTRPIRDGDTIVSGGKKFTLGFFNDSINRYVGIWYTQVPILTIVWVANRERPISDSSGILNISDDGNLVLMDGSRSILWSTNISISGKNSTAKLLDSGNLILSELSYENNGTSLWESFDNPTDTLLPNMKIGLNLKTNLNWSLTSWKSRHNPGRGEYSYMLYPQGKAQFYIMKGLDRYVRSGSWNGVRLSGVLQLTQVYLLNYTYVESDDEMYYIYNSTNDSNITILKLGDSGQLQRLTWSEGSSRWMVSWTLPADNCDYYALCGAYSRCSLNENWGCACLDGFVRKSPSGDAWDGCVRRSQLDCGNQNRDWFDRLEHVKLPDTTNCLVDFNSNLEECRNQCLNNCSCMAYASADISGGGRGCLNWYGDLVDLKVYPDNGQDIYIRMAASEKDSNGSQNQTKGSNGNRKNIMVPVVLTVTLGMLVLVSISCFFWRRKMKGQAGMERSEVVLSNLGRRADAEENFAENQIEERSHRTELPLFDLQIVVAATKCFSLKNKLGEGGFGPVYKGLLENGEEIAVKRLSKNSGQGKEEFQNEVMLIVKLQHRNLVKLLGCCIHGEERMLIYEYMPNKSLDSFIFDRSRRVLLDWKQRFDIIVGIARGILYLHQDSRLRIIHRDLKSSNILLDSEMRPKISDFGIARIFGGNQTQANTNRVVGTHGYMAPEYAMDGLFSVKSDVFSFGVILLEIVSGRKSTAYYHDDPSVNLIGHVWNMWKEGRGIEILDSFLNKSCPEREVLRCIQVGLLCVQESAVDRPSMSSAVFLLCNETTLPKPKQSVFNLQRNTDTPSPSTSGAGSESINDVTVTMIKGR